jgi:hypothetical protein
LPLTLRLAELGAGSESKIRVSVAAVPKVKLISQLCPQAIPSERALVLGTQRAFNICGNGFKTIAKS